MKIGYLMQAGVPEIRTPPFSGPANHVRKVFQELIGLGHQVRAVAFLDGQIWETDDLQSFEPVRVKALDTGPRRMTESAVRRVQRELRLPYIALFDSLRFASACRQALAGYDILIERLGWFGSGGALAARWLRLPRVLEVNGDLVSERRSLGIATSGLQHGLAMRILRNNVRTADSWVSTGTGWRERFADQFQLNPKDIAVIENGSEVVELLSREQLRCFQPITAREDGVRIVFTGSFDPWQGVSVLVEAFAQATCQASGLHLSLIGTGAGQEALTRLVQDRQLEACVSFPGWLPVGSMAERLAGADIGVAPYCGRVEFSGLKLLDYKAAGLAIIASGQDGQPAVIQHGQTGWIVPPCDARALSAAIVQVSRDPALRRRLGQAARSEAEHLHSWRNTARNIEGVLTKVLQSDHKA